MKVFTSIKSSHLIHLRITESVICSIPYRPVPATSFTRAYGLVSFVRSSHRTFLWDVVEVHDWQCKHWSFVAVERFRSVFFSVEDMFRAPISSEKALMIGL